MSNTLTTTQYPHQINDGEVTPAQLAEHMAKNPDLYPPGLREHADRITGVTETAASAMVAEVVEDPTEPQLEDLDGIRREDIVRLVKLSEFIRIEIDKDKTYHRDRYRYEDIEKHAQITPESKTQLGYDYLEHRSFIKDLREIRRGQSEYVRMRMAELPQDATPEEKRAVLIDALSYSPVLGARALAGIEGRSGFYSSKPILTKEEAIKSAETKESFQEALLQLLTTQPDIVIDQYRLLKHVVEPELLKVALYKTLQIAPGSLENKYSQDIYYLVKNVFESDEESKVFLTALMNKIPSMKPAIINYENLRGMYSKEELDTMVSEGVEAGWRELINDQLFIDGIISEEQILKILDTKDQRFIHTNIEGEKYLYAAANERYGKPSALPEHIKQYAKQKLLEHLDSDGLEIYEVFRIVDSGLFNEEEVQNYVRRLYQQKPSDTIAHVLSNEVADKYFSREELVEIVKNYLENQNIDDFGYRSVLFAVSKQGILPKENLKSYLDKLDGYTLVRYKHELSRLEIYSEEELKDKIKSAYYALSAEDRAFCISDVAAYLSEEEIKADVLAIYDAGVMIRLYGYYDEDFKSKLGDLDIGALNNQLFDRMLTGEIEPSKLDALLDELEKTQGFSAAKEAAAKLAVLSPESLILVIDRNARFFAPELIKSTIDKLLSANETRDLLISQLTYGRSVWIRYAEPEKVRGLLLDPPLSSLSTIALNRSLCLGFLTEEEFSGLVERFVDTNPAEALLSLDSFKRDSTDIDEARIAESVSKSRGISAVDKYLQATLTRAMSMTKEGSKQILLNEASVMYKALSVLSRNELLETARSLTEAEAMSGAKSLSLIESMAVLSLLGSPESVRAASSSSDVDVSLAKSIYSVAGVEFSPDFDAAKISQVSGEIRTLATYLNKHKASIEHARITKEILDSLIAGDYSKWKFGDGSPESLQSMKDLGLYPQGLSQEQLALWSRDDSSQVSEVFSVEADATAKILTEIIMQNQQFFDGAVDETESVKEEISELGKLIAETEKQKQVLKKTPEAAVANPEEQLRELELSAIDLRMRLAKLQLIDDLQSLLSLDSEQIQSGTLLQNDGSKGKTIDSIIQRVRKNAPQGAAEAINQITLALESFRGQTGEAVNMVVTDDSELLTTMRVGVEPVGSCQNYRTGVMNEALYGYTDANTKIIMLRNEKGSPVGRAIFRMLADEAGNPVLHVDTIYSTDISDGARRAIYAHAVKKAEAMGVPVFVSELSQNEDGDRQPIRPIPGLKLENANGAKLQSSASRAPFVYVDAGGGRQPKGVYSLGGVKRIGLEQAN